MNDRSHAVKERLVSEPRREDGFNVRGGVSRVSEGNVQNLSASAATVADLQVVELGFQLLDGAVRHLQIFVETIPLCDELHQSEFSVKVKGLKGDPRVAPIA